MKRKGIFFIVSILLSVFLSAGVGPKLELVDFNKNAPNPQKVGNVIDNVCTLEISDSSFYMCGRIALTAGIQDANGWTPVSDWMWEASANGKLLKEKEEVGGYTLGKGKFEIWNESSNIKNEKRYPNKENYPNAAIGGRWLKAGIENMVVTVTAMRVFEKNKETRMFGQSYSWGFKKADDLASYYCHQKSIDDENEEEPACTENITINCEDGSVITTHKCIDGKLIETGETCPDPEPQPEPEEERESLFTRIWRAIINFLKSIFG